MIINKIIIRNALISLLFLGGLSLVSCEKSQSYSELLREEEKAVNWFLAQHNVVNELPADSTEYITFQEAGEDAPFYRLDPDGYVYMQIVKADYSDMVEEGDLVYFRFDRDNIIYLQQGFGETNFGNSDYMGSASTSFIYKNNKLTSTTTWGTGIQMPLKYMGYNSEVNLVLKSYYGFLDEQSSCVPYLMNIRYFKAEY